MDGFISKSFNKSYISYYYDISYISDKFRGRILSANPIPQKMEHYSLRCISPFKVVAERVWPFQNDVSDVAQM